MNTNILKILKISIVFAYIRFEKKSEKNIIKGNEKKFKVHQLFLYHEIIILILRVCSFWI